MDQYNNILNKFIMSCIWLLITGAFLFIAFRTANYNTLQIEEENLPERLYLIFKVSLLFAIFWPIFFLQLLFVTISLTSYKVQILVFIISILFFYQIIEFGRIIFEYYVLIKKILRN
jgi:hypothetical protein